MPPLLADDAWTAKTQAKLELTLGEIIEAVVRVQDDKDAAALFIRAARLKDTTVAWRTGARPLTTEELDALLDDVAALYSDVVALGRRSTLTRDPRQS